MASFATFLDQNKASPHQAYIMNTPLKDIKMGGAQRLEHKEVVDTQKKVSISFCDSTEKKWKMRGNCQTYSTPGTGNFTCCLVSFVSTSYSF